MSFIDRMERITPWVTYWFTEAQVEEMKREHARRSGSSKSNRLRKEFGTKWTGVPGERAFERFCKDRGIPARNMAREEKKGHIDFMLDGGIVDVKTTATWYPPDSSFGVNVEAEQDKKQVVTHYVFCRYNLRVNAASLVGYISRVVFDGFKYLREAGERVTRDYEVNTPHWEVLIRNIWPMADMRKNRW